MPPPRKAGWWRGIATLRAEIECCGATHTIVWRGGALGLANHHVPSERGMIALGADTPRCLEILDLWRDALTSEVTATLHMWATGERMPPALATRLAGLGPGQRPTAAVTKLLARHTLSNVPSELFDRFGYAAIVKILRGHAPAAKENLLPQVLQRHVEAAVLASIASWHRTARTPVVWCTPCGMGEPTRIEVSDKAEMRTEAGAVQALPAGTVWVRAPLEWLLDVHARGCSLVDGLFVLEPNGPRWWAVRWEKARDGRLTPIVGEAQLERDGRAWRARWLGP